MLAVRRGDVPDKDDALAEIAAVRSRVEELLSTARTPLPERADLERSRLGRPTRAAATGRGRDTGT